MAKKELSDMQKRVLAHIDRHQDSAVVDICNHVDGDRNTIRSAVNELVSLGILRNDRSGQRLKVSRAQMSETQSLLRRPWICAPKIED